MECQLWPVQLEKNEVSIIFREPFSRGLNASNDMESFLHLKSLLLFLKENSYNYSLSNHVFFGWNLDMQTCLKWKQMDLQNIPWYLFEKITVLKILYYSFHFTEKVII